MNKIIGENGKPVTSTWLILLVLTIIAVILIIASNNIANNTINNTTNNVINNTTNNEVNNITNGVINNTTNTSLNKSLFLSNGLSKSLSSNQSTVNSSLNITVSDKLLSISDTPISTTSENTQSDWCIPNTKIIINFRNYTISGITTIKNHEVCKAAIQIPNGETIHYWSKDKSFDYETSIAKSDGTSKQVIAISNAIAIKN